MRSAKRISAGVLCAVFLLAALTAFCFAVHHADHDCCGEDCPVCRVLAANARALRLTGSLMMGLPVLFAAVLWAGAPRSVRGHAPKTTPVALKIRLNN